MKQDRNILSRVDRGWTNMHRTLEIEMPQKKDRRIFFWVFFGLAVLSLVLFLLVSKLKDSNHRVANSINVENTSKTLTTNTATTQVISETVNTKEIKDNKSEMSNFKTVDTVSESKTSTSTNKFKANNQNSNSKQESSNSTANLKSNLNNTLVKKRNIESSKITPNESTNNLKLIEKTNSRTDKIVETKTSKTSEISKLNIASITSKTHLLTEAERSLISMKLKPEVLPVITPIHHEWKTELSIGINTDYFTSLNTLGATTFLGIQFRKNKLGVGIVASYSDAVYSWNQSNNFEPIDSEESDLRLANSAFDLMDPNTVFGGFAPTQYKSEISIEESVRYISSGIKLDYLLSESFSIYTLVGMEFHLNEYVTLREMNEDNLGDLEIVPEELSLQFNDNYFLESGISYSINSNLSLMSSFRYVPNNLIEIIDFDSNSSKLSIGAKYLF